MEAMLGEPVTVPLSDGGIVEGDLVVPPRARSLVVFAHGGWGESLEFAIAELLRQSGTATLILDSRKEGGEPLAARVVAACDWVETNPKLCHLAVGTCGIGDGAAAVLRAAGERPWGVGAVVICGGRLDITPTELERVRAPVLIMASGSDLDVLERNRNALRWLHEFCVLKVFAGADPNSTAPGSLQQVAREARGWFARHLGAAQAEPILLH